MGFHKLFNLPLSFSFMNFANGCMVDKEDLIALYV